jgi:hypothetical protein
VADDQSAGLSVVVEVEETRSRAGARKEVPEIAKSAVEKDPKRVSRPKRLSQMQSKQVRPLPFAMSYRRCNTFDLWCPKRLCLL